MGRLRGLSALGMPVSLLLAYFWSSAYACKDILLSPLQGPARTDALTDEEVKIGQQKAGEFKKQLRTAEEQALFSSHQVDGKGRRILFVTTWQALQHLLSKAKDALRVAAFWKSNKDDLFESFSPPAAYLQLEQHVTNFHTVTSLGDSLMSIEAQPDGSIFAMVKDWQSFEIFLSEYEAFTSADFYAHNTTGWGGMANRL